MSRSPSGKRDTARSRSKAIETFVCNDHTANTCRFPVARSVSNVLLRGCVLRQTKFVYGAVIFTGHDTKLYKNASGAPFKVSFLMKMMNRCLILVFAFQALICATNTFFAKRFNESEIGKNQVYANNPYFTADNPYYNFNVDLELGIGFEIER